MINRKSFLISFLSAFVLLTSETSYSQGSPIQYIDGCKSFISVTKLMRQSFIDVYGREKLKGLQYPDFKFSPNGQFIALEVLPEEANSELWLFDLKSFTWRMIIERISRKKVELYIRGFSWIANDTLAVFLNRSDKEHGLVTVYGDGRARIANPKDEKYNGDFVVRATMNSSIVERFAGPDVDESIDPTDYPIFNTSPSGRWRFVSSYPSDTTSLIDLKSNGGIPYSMKYFHGRFEWTKDEKFVVFVKGEGHGSFALEASLMKSKLNPFIIKGGSWEKLGFCVSPKGHFVAYPRENVDDRRGAIVIYDLDLKKTVRIIQIGLYPDRVAWSSQNSFAVTCVPCESKSEEQGVSKEVHVYDLSQFMKK